MAAPRYGKKKIKMPPIFYIFIVLATLIALLVLMFVVFVINDNKQQTNLGSLPESSDISSDISSKSTPSESVSEVSSEVSQSSQESIESSPPPVALDKSYMNDALIIGDSISMGFSVYGVLPGENVLANRNVSLDKIHLGKDVYSTPQGNFTFDAALEGKSPAKIYILLGSNGIPGLENAQHIKYYEEMLQKVRAKFANAVLYVQSVTPVTQKCQQNRPEMDNAKINEFNSMIQELAPKYQAHYLDISSILKDENGFLKDQYAGSDGIHFKSNTYPDILNYYLLNKKS